MRVLQHFTVAAASNPRKMVQVNAAIDSLSSPRAADASNDVWCSYPQMAAFVSFVSLFLFTDYIFNQG